MATQITATAPRSRPAPRVVLFGVAVLAVVAIAAVAVGVWSSTAPAQDTTGADGLRPMTYPFHGGLAGPSVVDQATSIEPGAHFGSGYPSHGGLAGPSVVGQAASIEPGAHFGSGYPSHGGLAGPSVVGGGE